MICILQQKPQSVGVFLAASFPLRAPPLPQSRETRKQETRETATASAGSRTNWLHLGQLNFPPPEKRKITLSHAIQGKTRNSTRATLLYHIGATELLFLRDSLDLDGSLRALPNVKKKHILHIKKTRPLSSFACSRLSKAKCFRLNPRPTIIHCFIILPCALSKAEGPRLDPPLKFDEPWRARSWGRARDLSHTT